MPNHTVQQGGLYGALLALPSGLRFCSTPEMYLLQLRQIVEIFARLFESRVKASTLSIHEVEGGFMLSLSDIAATIPMHLCEDLVMRSPVDEIKIHVQVGPKIAEVLRVLMGASTPDDISLVPGGILDHKVPLHPDVLMRLEKTTLFASVHACLLMPTMMFGRSEGDARFVIALCPFGTVAAVKRANMRVGDVIDFLKLEFDQRPLYC